MTPAELASIPEKLGHGLWINGEVRSVVVGLLDHIAQLEAHKTESAAVFSSLQIQEIAKEIGAPLGSGVPEQILPWIKSAKVQLEAQRGEVVEVPDLTNGCVIRWWNEMANKNRHCHWNSLDDSEKIAATREYIIKHMATVLADRVFKDGMVGVDREECDLLGRLHMVAMQFVMDADPAQRRSAAHLVQAVAALRQYAGRSAKGEAET